MMDMVIHFKSVSNCTSEQLTRTFAVLVRICFSPDVNNVRKYIYIYYPKVFVYCQVK